MITESDLPSPRPLTLADVHSLLARAEIHQRSRVDGAQTVFDWPQALAAVCRLALEQDALIKRLTETLPVVPRGVTR